MPMPPTTMTGQLWMLCEHGEAHEHTGGEFTVGSVMLGRPAKREWTCPGGHPVDIDYEKIAQAFHEEYERLAPSFGYSTRSESRTPWPPPNADLMVATVAAVVERFLIPLPNTETEK